MFAFVILNYNSFSLTVDCIHAIRKLSEKIEKKVVVVDNHTLMSEEEKHLRSLCDALLVNEENLGFAKGNNIGVRYAYETYQVDFVCILNSDCMILQKDFLEQVIKIYEKESFAMLGPKIISYDCLSWNPFPVFKDLARVKEEIRYQEKMIKFYKSRILYFLLQIYLFLKGKPKKIDRNGLKQEEGVALHGCCILFSKKYLDTHKDAFYPETFLYHEEEFLYYRVLSENLKSIYSPSIEVVHLEGMATQKTFKNKRKKCLFKTENILLSLYKLQKIMENKERI